VQATALIKEHRTKDAGTQAALAEQFWSDLFRSFFVETTDCHADDLVILVKKGASSDPLDVYRRGAKTRPMPEAGNPNYNWEESTCLNLLLQDTTYMLTVAVCSRDPQSKKLKVIHKLSNQVYASPSKRSMESKSTDEIITYPLLYFSIDDFDQRFEDVVVAPTECVCVELVAKSGEVRSTVFSGAVTHSQLAASFSTKSSRQLFASKSKKGAKMEFLHMLGPKGLGQAEMAVSTVLSLGLPCLPTGLLLFSRGGGGVTSRSTSLLELKLAHMRNNNTPFGREGPHVYRFLFFCGIAHSEGISNKTSDNGDGGGGGGGSTGGGGGNESSGLAIRFSRAFSMVKDIVGNSAPDAAECRLNAYLTFVSLSWKTMVENVIENIQPPALDKHTGLATGGEG
jgi:uncharacterized membrane protein YgcG